MSLIISLDNKIKSYFFANLSLFLLAAAITRVNKRKIKSSFEYESQKYLYFRPVFSLTLFPSKFINLIWIKKLVATLLAD